MARRSGFTLVEAAVAIAVVAILAGMMAPLGLKALNQRREAQTRRDLQKLWEAMFGSRDHRVANMASDFGLQASRWDDLDIMLQPEPGVIDPPPFGLHGSPLPWGYNGPYWLGDVGTRQEGGRRVRFPVDAWGSPILMDVTGHHQPLEPGPSTFACQLRSLGPDKRRSADDIVYPPVPVLERTHWCHLLVTVTRVSPVVRGQVEVAGPYWLEARHRRPGEPHRLVMWGQVPAVMKVDLRPPDTLQTFTLEVRTPACELHFTPAAGSPLQPVILPLDLLPGETREVRLTL